jgi:DNA-binding SARP family transcriptional activator
MGTRQDTRHFCSADGEGTIVHLLGGLYVTKQGILFEVPEGSKRLLAFLALRRGRVERCHAAGALWPHGTDHRASGNLRSALWRLRGAEIDVFEADKWALRLRDNVRVDLHDVADCAGRLIADSPVAEDLGMAPMLIQALDLLPGCYDDWAILERERIRQRVLHALETLSRQLARLGRYAEAVEAALVAIDVEPLRESAQRALFEVHIGEGNWVEARRGFVTYRSLVRQELGVEPSRELAELVGLAFESPPRPRLSPDHRALRIS